MKKTAVVLTTVLLSAAALAQAEKPVTKENSAEAAKTVTPATPSWQEEQRKLIIFYERQLYEAEKRHDWPAIARRLAPDFLELAGDGKFYTKEQTAAGFKDVKLDSYKMSDVEVRALAPSAAVIAYKLEVTASVAGKQLPGTFLVSSAWARVGGAWMIKLHQGTVVPK